MTRGGKGRRSGRDVSPTRIGSLIIMWVLHLSTDFASQCLNDISSYINGFIIQVLASDRFRMTLPSHKGVFSSPCGCCCVCAA